MKVYEAVARVLVDQGVTDVFGVMGDGNLKLIPHLTSTAGVRMVGARHEAAALAMADGYARTIGRVGVCTVTQGPGLTNTLTALISARKARTPLVLLAGDTPHGVPGLPQDCDQDALLAAAGIPVQPFRAETAAADVAAAFERARRAPGPVAISMPTDVQDAEHAGAIPPPPTPVEADVVAPDPDQLAAAVARLRTAERPIVLAGRGAVRAGAREAAIALADAAGALLATSLPGKGYFDGHPWSLGICGGLATPLGVELLRDADVVVVLGASVNSFTSKAGSLFRPPTELIHVDADAGAIGAYTPATLAVVGDAGATAVQMRDALVAAGPCEGEGYRTAAVRARLDDFDLAQAHADASDGEALDPRTVCARLEELLPRDRSLVTDGGHFCGFPAGYLSVPEPSAFIFSLDFGSVGLGLGTALGAAVARPDRLTVLGIGDGGLMMSLGDLETAGRYGIPLLVLVFDDGAYGAEMHFLRMLGLPEEQSLFPTPDLVGVAESVGVRGMRIRSLDDLEGLAAAAADLSEPLLAHITVNRDVRAEWLEEAFARTVGH
ncbi:thiamine pyrophosphate-binding protein [Euzebya sp.]|uniref:thiamine pyrophosphate-binding protein n=1 Tax=Euzebya sp. TaxID=1971409 RepID=UPI00351196F5